VADRLAILHRLPSESDGDVVQQAKVWLAQQDTRPISEEPADVTVNQVAHVWRVRFQISLEKGHPLQGAEPLLSRLDALEKSKKLEQYGFIGRETAGNIFFEKKNKKFVGAVLFDRRVNVAAS
jgi:hypothetical protein